jgi:ABC-type sugar transport system ATPase subunit
MNDLLTLQNIEKSFPGVRAVKDVTLGIAHGEIGRAHV